MQLELQLLLLRNEVWPHDSCYLATYLGHRTCGRFETSVVLQLLSFDLKRSPFFEPICVRLHFASLCACKMYPSRFGLRGRNLLSLLERSLFASGDFFHSLQITLAFL